MCLLFPARKSRSPADLFTYYGYKFETVCTSADRGPAPALVDSTSEFALLLRVGLGDHALLMAAEVDCVSPEAAGSVPMLPDHFLELKTVK